MLFQCCLSYISRFMLFYDTIDPPAKMWKKFFKKQESFNPRNLELYAWQTPHGLERLDAWTDWTPGQTGQTGRLDRLDAWTTGHLDRLNDWTPEQCGTIEKLYNRWNSWATGQTGRLDRLDNWKAGWHTDNIQLDNCTTGLMEDFTLHAI